MRGNFRLADNGSSMWELSAGTYRVFDLPDSSTNLSTEICTPPYSSASTLNTPLVVKIKIEPNIHNVIHLFDSSMVMNPLCPLPFPSHFHPPSVPPLLPHLFCPLFLHPLLNPPFPLFNVYVLWLLCWVGKTSLRS